MSYLTLYKKGTSCKILTGKNEESRKVQDNYELHGMSAIILIPEVCIYFPVHHTPQVCHHTPQV